MSKHKIYPFAVAVVRSKENNLISKEKLIQMADAPTPEDALRVLTENGYGELPAGEIHDFEKLLSAQLSDMYKSVAGLIPEEKVVDVFLYKNDYHNIKVLIKQELSGIAGESYLIDGGTVPVETLKNAFLERKFTDMLDIDVKAIEEAMEEYAKTKDGRCIDLILDKACFETMSMAAGRTKNAYVIEYVKLLADVTNIKTFVRVKRPNKSFKLFEEAYVPGGRLGIDTFVKAYESDSPQTVLSDAGYKQLCEDCMTCSFTEFEKNCDNFLMSYVQDAKYKSLTLEPIVGYILGKETEIKCVRIIMTCKLNNIDTETIKERVREAYV
ncbi:V-type sodium ATPase subunit C [Clostridiales bacterium]|nr:V-type sodium ATPase subunit C [Clostridiales bacterium]